MSILSHNISARDAERQKLAADMAAYEAQHGPVETIPTVVNNPSSLYISAGRIPDSRMSEARKKMISARNGK